MSSVSEGKPYPVDVRSFRRTLGKGERGPVGAAVSIKIFIKVY